MVGAVGSEVRSSRVADAPGLRDVMEACLATDGIPGFVRSDIDRALVRIVPDPEGTVVAIDDGRVVGYCTPRSADAGTDGASSPRPSSWSDDGVTRTCSYMSRRICRRRWRSPAPWGSAIARACGSSS
jgi:hypothetical protein